MLCEIWAHEWRVVRYHFSSLCDFWERTLFLYKATKPKNLMKATWAWFPISLLTVPSFTSEALHHIVWLPTASDPVRLKSFFKQQSSLKVSIEGEMMPSKTEKPTQRNVFQTSWKFPGDQSCDMVTPSQTLFQNSGYDGCLFTICLRKKVKSRVLLTCVFTLGCWDICWEQRYPNTVLEKSFTSLLGPQQGLLVSAYFFHVVWRDNLYAIVLGCVSHSKKPFSRKPDLFGCPGEWQAGPTTAVSTHLWRGRLFQLSLLCSCQEGERAVAAVVGEECKSEACSEWSGKEQAGMHEGKAQSIA